MHHIPLTKNKQKKVRKRKQMVWGFKKNLYIKNIMFDILGFKKSFISNTYFAKNLKQ